MIPKMGTYSFSHALRQGIYFTDKNRVKAVLSIQLQWENSSHEQSNRHLRTKEHSFFSGLLRSLPAMRAITRPHMVYMPDWSGTSGE